MMAIMGSIKVQVTRVSKVNDREKEAIVESAYDAAMADRDRSINSIVAYGIVR